MKSSCFLGHKIKLVRVAVIFVKHQVEQINSSADEIGLEEVGLPDEAHGNESVFDDEVVDPKLKDLGKGMVKGSEPSKVSILCLEEGL